MAFKDINGPIMLYLHMDARIHINIVPCLNIDAGQREDCFGFLTFKILLDQLQSYSLQHPTQVVWILASWWISLEVVGNLTNKGMKLLITYFWASLKFL